MSEPTDPVRAKPGGLGAGAAAPTTRPWGQRWWPPGCEGLRGTSSCHHLRLPLLVHPVDLPTDKHPDFALSPPLLAPQEVGDEQCETCPQNTRWQMRRW